MSSSAPSADADIGILNADLQEGGSAANDNDAPTSRWDVYKAIHSTDHCGSCSAADKCDGTTTTPTLPSTLGLRVNGIGDLPLPISDSHAKALKTNAWKIKDDSFHKVYQVEPQKMKIENPVWDTSLAKLLKTAAYKMGVHPGHLSAELDSKLFNCYLEL